MVLDLAQYVFGYVCVRRHYRLLERSKVARDYDSKNLLLRARTWCFRDKQLAVAPAFVARVVVIVPGRPAIVYAGIATRVRSERGGGPCSTEATAVF
jgi:hypothetical protein